MISKSLRVCPKCKAVDSVRIILYGMPSSEPDPDRYVIGGCCISPDGIDPEMECIKCEWQGSKRDVRRETKLNSLN